MLQYSLITTAIWLLSLLVYEMLLSKESFHNYNRAYLLSAFALGLVHPLFVLPHEDVVRTYTPVKYTMQQASAATGRITEAITPPQSASFHWEALLLIVYLTGMLVAAGFLLKEVFTLVKYYAAGKKTKTIHNWTIIETGKEHSPFSLCRWLFISAKDKYSTEEWDIIFAHEQRHFKLFHIADLLLMQFAKIVFWFHPLVYLFGKKLLQVHEYQADRVQQHPVEVYGRFLIEQSILSNAPSLSHSFSRSPLKNRIMMLKKQSANLARIKAFLAIPAIAAFVLFSSNCRQTDNKVMYSRSMEVSKNGHVALYKGNEIGLKLRKPDSTGNWADEPVSLNGEKVYNVYTDKELETKPEFTIKGSSLGHYLFENLEDDFATLEDGRYNLPFSNNVIDATGELVYYDYHGMHPVDVEVEESKYITRFDNKIKTLLYNAPKFIPATAHGKPVPSTFWGIFKNEFYVVVVKDHVASLEKTGESEYL